MKKLTENVATYLIEKMAEQAQYAQIGLYKYHYRAEYNNLLFKFSLDENSKKILVERGVKSKDSFYFWTDLGNILNDYTAKPKLEFASELFDIAIDGITREANAGNLEEELPIKGNAVKTKKMKI